jgi:hypothetical protein
MSSCRLSRWFVVGAAAALGCIPLLARAQTPPQTVGIRLVDAPIGRAADPRAHEYIIDHVAPGATITRHVEVSNDTSAQQLIQLYAAAATVKDGAFRFGEGRASNDLTSWTTVTPPTENLASAAKALAVVTIQVPASASAGERYGVVWAELPPATPPGGGVTAVNRVGVRIYLSVGAGGEPASDFSITSLTAQRDADGNPVVAAAVRNTGGRALDLGGELRLTAGPGGLSAGPFDAKLGTTLGIGETEPVLVVLDKAVPTGPWAAHIVLRSGTVERDATATLTFPERAATSARAVTPRHGGSGLFLPALGALAGLIGLLVFVLLLMRRRRRRGLEAAS